MLRTTVSKLRHICALAYFVPRLLRGNLRYIPGRFEKLSVNVQRRVDKSTDSSPQDEDDYERCQRIIDRAFSPNPPIEYYTREVEIKPKTSLNMMAPDPETQCEKCQRIINEIFGEDTNAGDKKREIVDPVCIPTTELQATTAKENVETLAQKVEVIDETPLVEAAAKSKIEGFNLHPKVLGHNTRRRALERSPILNYSTDKPIYGRRRGVFRKDNSFDELAKRCLDSPSGQIDERLLKEMEKLGVPPSTRRGTRKTANDAGIVQPEIMRRPRRPVEKTELDFLSRMKRLRELERINDILPPPFELTPVKANSVNLSSSCETEDENRLCLERLPPFHLTDRIKTLPENEDIEPSPSAHFEKPPQQLLGHLTATVMSNESDMMKDEDNDIEHVIIRQERLRTSPLNDSSTITSEASPQQEPEVVLRTNDNEKISLSKLQQTEKENTGIIREKIASTNLLSDLVDPNEISPQGSNSLVNKYKEIETLRNLLQTRLEHLTNTGVKSRRTHEYLAEFSKGISRVKNVELDEQQRFETLKVERIKPHYLKNNPNITSYNETSPSTQPSILIRGVSAEHEIIKESQDSSPTKESGEQQGFETLTEERIKPYHLKYDPNIMCKENSPHTQPGIFIRGVPPENEVIKEDQDKNELFRGYSPNQKLITPHQLFEQISLISRETELGTADDYKEIDYSTSDKPTPCQLLDNVGIVSKDDSSSGENKVLPEKNVDNFLKNKDNVVDPYGRNVADYGPEDYEYAYLVEHEEIKLLEHTLLSASELSRRPLDEEETGEPVIAVEMGRIDNTDPNQIDPKLVMFKSNKDTDLQETNESRSVAPEVLTAVMREPVLQKSDGHESNTTVPDTLLNPLLDKGTVASVDKVEFNTNIFSNTIPKEHNPESLTLSEMLKRVRERNRMEICREFVELRMQNVQVDPLVGECGKKKPPCPPPPPSCPPPPKPPCPPTKPPCPNPCKPKCPPTCPPEPCGEPKPKCPPAKKSPCEKFKKCSCVKIQDALTLLLYLGPQLHIPQKSLLPVIACALNINTSIQDTHVKAMERIIMKLQDLCSIVMISSLRGDTDALEAALAGKEGIDYARTYDPWTPIPSWPIPVKEKKKKLVCPKEGCKVIPPKLNAPCREINPCADLPRHNKFSIVDYIFWKAGTKVVNDTGEF